MPLPCFGQFAIRFLRCQAVASTGISPAFFGSIGMAIVVAAFSIPTVSAADRALVEGIRLSTQAQRTRVVLDIDRPLEARVFAESNPQRLIIDLANTRLAGSIPRVSKEDIRLARIRFAHHDNGRLRLVFDLKRAVRWSEALFAPAGEYGHRLVFDIRSKVGDAEASPPPLLRGASAPAASSPSLPSSSSPVAVAVDPDNRCQRGQWDPDRLRDTIVVIDPGHGGRDPGAVAPSGLREKDVVMAISRYLARLIDSAPGMRAILTRTSDRRVPLRNRTGIARTHRASLFISIHADAFRNPRISGSSVYILSHKGESSEEGRWLAARENAAALAGGDSLDGISLRECEDDDFVETILDYSQTGARKLGTHAAVQILAALTRSTKLRKRNVDRAGFVVLKAPNIPSLLIETGFMTNPTDAKRLATSSYQRKIAAAIMQGIEAHFKKFPPPGSLLEVWYKGTDHRVERGDTLSELSLRYRVSVQDLRRLNKLQGDLIRVGQVLRVPPTEEG